MNEGSVTRSYIVMWRVASTLLNRTVLGTSTTITSLQSNSAYVFTITASNSNGAGQSSNPVTFHTRKFLCLEDVLELGVIT